MKPFRSLIALSVLVGCAEVDADGDGFTTVADCDDDNVLIHPGANEFCDGVDNDCSGEADDAYAADGALFFVDVDGDGFGTEADSQWGCPSAPPEGYVADATDCDDDDADRYPAAPELCNLKDDNCNGNIDDDPEDAPIWYADYDKDGFGSRSLLQKACQGPTGWIKTGNDCNDFDPIVNPNAIEYCDRVDNDCDDQTDEPDAADHRVFYKDVDGDGYGDVGAPIDACWLPEGYAESDLDCNDDPAKGGSGQVPGTDEICKDGIDNNCNDDPDQCGIKFYEATSQASIAFSGSGNSDYLGYSVDFAGDVDGDGKDDLLMGAYYRRDGSLYGVGAVYLVYGDDTYESGKAKVKATLSPAWTGATSYEYVGQAVSRIGDFNKDGFDDFVFGGPGYDPVISGSTRFDGGQVYIVYGSGTRADAGFKKGMDVLPTIQGTTSYGRLGGGVQGIGDFDKDGHDDFVMGGYGYSNSAGGSYAGAAMIVYGQSAKFVGNAPDTSFPTRFEGEASSNYFAGYPDMLGSGDFNGDGDVDLVFGSHYANGYLGRAYVFEGSGSRSLWSGSVSAADASVIIDGTTTYTYLGYALSGIRDLNGDGYGELAVGAYGAGGGNGEMYVFFGTKDGVDATDAGDADVTITGNNYEYIGYSRAQTADVDQDGLQDLVVGGYYWRVGSVYGLGAMHVFNGRTSWASNYDTYDTEMTAAGSGSYVYFGRSITAGGDFNGDGYPDMAGGAYGDNGYDGAVYLFEGTSL